MSKAEGSVILDTNNAGTTSDKLEKMAKPCPSSVLRRKLADISNLPQRPRLTQDEKSQSVSLTAKEYIEQLQKEILALKMMLAQRNKIIEQSGIELDKMRVNLLKMQEQNQHLAVSNTQMLAELNSGKDRLKAVQHELGCKNGVLRALEHEKARMKTCGNVNIKEETHLKETRDDAKPRNMKRTLRSKSFCPSENVQSMEKAENKSLLVRRQSARFKSAELKSANNSSERVDVESPASHPPDDCESVPAESNSFQEEGEPSREVQDDYKPRSCKRSLPLTDCGPSDYILPRDKSENKRPFTRRQSARFKAAELTPAEDSFEKDKCPLPEDPALHNESTAGNVSVKTEESEDISVFHYESQQFGRSSLCRPSRQAAKKVQSYKEIPINIKMRRW